MIEVYFSEKKLSGLDTATGAIFSSVIPNRFIFLNHLIIASEYNLHKIAYQCHEQFKPYVLTYM